MLTFWENLYKFPRFFTSVLIGFFLTTLEPIFKQLKSKKSRIKSLVLITIIIRVVYIIIRKMNGIE
uniref:Uncharacterized protein ycf33 n=1 Tax=Chondria sp. (in: red algae) TaxID=1982705 RepID=A0A1Z1MDA9_9FLOR|nr:hypothetical protein [Chondria sp. (in: red algae)]